MGTWCWWVGDASSASVGAGVECVGETSQNTRTVMSCRMCRVQYVEMPATKEEKKSYGYGKSKDEAKVNLLKSVKEIHR